MSYESDIKEVLAAYKAGMFSDDEVIERFHKLNITDLGYASLTMTAACAGVFRK